MCHRDRFQAAQRAAVRHRRRDVRRREDDATIDARRGEVQRPAGARRKSSGPRRKSRLRSRTSGAAICRAISSSMRAPTPSPASSDAMFHTCALPELNQKSGLIAGSRSVLSARRKTASYFADRKPLNDRRRVERHGVHLEADLLELVADHEARRARDRGALSASSA